MTSSRRVLLAPLVAALVFALVPIPVASGENAYELRFAESAFISRIKPDEMELLKQKVRDAYPGAVDRVVAFVGREDARKLLRVVTVAIYDYGKHERNLGRVRPDRSVRVRREKSIFLFGIPFLIGNAEVQSVLAHEMIHLIFQDRQGYAENASMPRELKEGLAYFGAAESERNLIAFVNSRGPEFDIDKVMADEKDRDRLWDLLFGYCIREAYGDEGLRALIDRLYRGKEWRRSLEGVAGEPLADVRKRCEQCIRDELRKRKETAGPCREMIAANKEKRFPDAIRIGTEYLASQPAGDWRPRIALLLAKAYRETGETDRAIETFDAIRTERFGASGLEGTAAYEIVWTLVTARRCAEAQAKRDEFGRLHPSWRKRGREDLDKLLDENCGPASDPKPAPGNP